MITIDHRSEFLIDQSIQVITSRKSLKEQGMIDSEIDQEISSGQYTEVKNVISSTTLFMCNTEIQINTTKVRFRDVTTHCFQSSFSYEGMNSRTS